MGLCIMSGCRRERAPGSEYCYVHRHHSNADWSTAPTATDIDPPSSVLDDISNSFPDTTTDTSVSADTNDFSFGGGDSGGGGAGGDF